MSKKITREDIVREAKILVNEWPDQTPYPQPKNPFINMEVLKEMPAIKSNAEFTFEFIDCLEETKEVIKYFVDSQIDYSINANGTIERNAIINEFKKYCYVNKITVEIKNQELIELVKDEYYKLINPPMTKKEFFESLKK